MTENNRRYKCECGSDVDISGKKLHFKSKKHNKFLEKQEEERKKQEEWEIRRQAKKNTTDDDICTFCHYSEYNCHCGLISI